MAQNNPANTEQELNEILRLRREKLAALKEAGSDRSQNMTLTQIRKQ